MATNRIVPQAILLFLSILIFSCGGEENSFLEDVDHIPVDENLTQENNSNLDIRRAFTLSQENYITSDHFAVFYGLNAGRLDNEARIILEEAEAAWDLGIVRHNMKIPVRSATSYIPIVLEGTDINILNIGANGTYISHAQRGYYITLKSSAFLNTTGGANTGSVELVREVFKTFMDPEPGNTGFDYSQWYVSAIPGLLTQELYPGNIKDLDFGIAYAMNPQLPLWSYEIYLGFQKGSFEFTWSEANHANGKEVFLRYLVDNEILTIDEIVAPLRESREFNALSYLNETLDAKGQSLKQVFADFSAHTVTWDYDKHGTVMADLQNTLAQEHTHNLIADTIPAEGIDNWSASSTNLTPSQWSYNVIQLEHDADASYNLTFTGSQTGVNGTPSDFMVTIVRRNENNRTYEQVQISNDQSGSAEISTLAADEDVYIVVASVPDVYEGDMDFFDYSLDVTKVD